MDASKRIVVNTLAQHIRSVVNICLSLYSTRLILQALGHDDFGIYSLVAGVVAMLGFLNNAMVVTTQRQLSFWHGRGNVADVRRMFSNSLLLHIVFAMLLAAVLVAIAPLLFSGVLVIEPSRMDAARVVYILVVLSLLVTFLTTPYRAIFIARENIVYISIVDVADGVLKLIAALWLTHCPTDRLIAYAWVVLGIWAFNWLALMLWARTHFEETLLLPRLSDISRKALGELTGFAGWTVYSLGCIIGRAQGMAVVLNRFFGTVVNASYGIAMQMQGALYFVAHAIVNAMSPQLYKAEGGGDRQRMIALAEATSKYAYLLMALPVVPLLFEMDAILEVWLGDVPRDAAMLCQMVLAAALADQVTTGLNVANLAVGRLRDYSLVINTLKILTLPAMALVLSMGYGMTTAMWVFLGIEIVGALLRLPFLKATAGLSIRHYAATVFLRLLLPTAALIVCCQAVVSWVHVPFRFLLTIGVSTLVCTPIIWYTALAQQERKALCNMLKPKKTLTR